MNKRVERMKQLLDETPIGSNDSRMLNKMEAFMKELEEFNKLDHDFKVMLEDIAQHDASSLHDKYDYPLISKTLSSDTTVIYFKSAGVFRAYDNIEFTEKFQNRLRTNYRGEDEIYEVVDNNRPQKIVIVVDSRDDAELEKIKSYIISYVNEEKQKIKMDDLVVFDNVHKNTFEIIISNISVSNALESRQFIDKLMLYIEKAENSVETSTKMLTRPMPDIEGANLVMIPEIKHLLDPFSNILDGYVTRGTHVTINLTQNIIKGDNYNVEGNINHYYESEKNNVVKDFINHLQQTKPKWYFKGNVITYNTLLNEYKENFEDIKPAQFTKKFGGIIFKKGKRASINNKRIQMIKIL